MRLPSCVGSARAVSRLIDTAPIVSMAPRPSYGATVLLMETGPISTREPLSISIRQLLRPYNLTSVVLSASARIHPHSCADEYHLLAICWRLPVWAHLRMVSASQPVTDGFNTPFQT